MTTPTGARSHTNITSNLTMIKGLTYVMFAMFAMTTDSVGIIIPQIVKTFRLSLTAAGTFQYATMAGIAMAGFLLGHLADRYGRKTTIVAGLTLFAASSYLFIAGSSFLFFCVLMALSGVAIGIFKTGALALIGDISHSTAEHTSIMNTVEGFFGIGSIIGPALLAQLLKRNVRWQWLYVIAGSMCVLLILTALRVQYPTRAAAAEDTNLQAVMTVTKNRFVLLFSLGAFLYVAVESAIYVWMPTLFEGYHGREEWIAVYSISIFFLLRAGGRFLGAWMLTKLAWSTALTICSGAILGCFVGEHRGRRALGRLRSAFVGTVHVHHLPNSQLQGHQLCAENGARCGRGRDSLLILASRLCSLRWRSAPPATPWADRFTASCSPLVLPRCYSLGCC